MTPSTEQPPPRARAIRHCSALQQRSVTPRQRTTRRRSLGEWQTTGPRRVELARLGRRYEPVQAQVQPAQTPRRQAAEAQEKEGSMTTATKRHQAETTTQTKTPHRDSVHEPSRDRPEL